MLHRLLRRGLSVRPFIKSTVRPLGPIKTMQSRNARRVIWCATALALVPIDSAKKHGQDSNKDGNKGVKTSDSAKLQSSVSPTLSSGSPTPLAQHSTDAEMQRLLSKSVELSKTVEQLVSEVTELYENPQYPITLVDDSIVASLVNVCIAGAPAAWGNSPYSVSVVMAINRIPQRTDLDLRQKLHAITFLGWLLQSPDSSVAIDRFASGATINEPIGPKTRDTKARVSTANKGGCAEDWVEEHETGDPDQKWGEGNIDDIPLLRKRSDAKPGPSTAKKPATTAASSDVSSTWIDEPYV